MAKKHSNISKGSGIRIGTLGVSPFIGTCQAGGTDIVCKSAASQSYREDGHPTTNQSEGVCYEQDGKYFIKFVGGQLYNPEMSKERLRFVASGKDTPTKFRKVSKAAFLNYTLFLTTRNPRFLRLAEVS